MKDVLFVAAVKGEAAHLPAGSEVLITGVGCVAAAAVLSERLAQGPRPARVINVGTAGALIDDHSGVFEITHVYKHDFDTDALERITGQPFPNEIALEPISSLPTARLATGDAFISSAAKREELARRAQLCDMEGWAIAWVCRRFGVPVTLLKQVSDNADESATDIWADAVERGARELAAALTALD